MKRYVSGIGKADPCSDQGVPGGVFLVCVEHAKYGWHSRKAYLSLLFRVLQPENLIGRRFDARLSCTPKLVWKLSWFLRDFGYDSELLERDEIDEEKAIGLIGVVKITRTLVRGVPVLNLEGFAPKRKWHEFLERDGSGTVEAAS